MKNDSTFIELGTWLEMKVSKDDYLDFKDFLKSAVDINLDEVNTNALWEQDELDGFLLMWLRGSRETVKSLISCNKHLTECLEIATDKLNMALEYVSENDLSLYEKDVEEYLCKKEN